MEKKFEYDVTEFVTHSGGACEFDSLEKAGKAFKDFINGLGVEVVGVVGVIQTEHHDPPLTTLEDGLLIVFKPNTEE